MNFSDPNFWRHLAAYVVGGALVGLPLLVPALAPAAPYMIPAGLGLVGIGGTPALPAIIRAVTRTPAPAPAAASGASSGPTPTNPPKAG